MPGESRTLSNNQSLRKRVHLPCPLTRMYKRSDDWMLAVSLTEQFDLAGLFASVPAVKSVLENLFNIKARQGASAISKTKQRPSHHNASSAAHQRIVALIRAQHFRATARSSGHAPPCSSRLVPLRPRCPTPLTPSPSSPTPQGQISIDLYVDQNNVALFLDCKGEIDILPVLDIPPIKGELGVLLSIGFGEVRRLGEGSLWSRGVSRGVEGWRAAQHWFRRGEGRG